jgi:hypothetical protein
MANQERENLLSEYAKAARVFCSSVERLEQLGSDVEAFIGGLAETGTTHRACEKARVRLDKHLAKPYAQTGYRR